MSSEGTLNTLIPSMVETIKETCRTALEQYPESREQAVRITVFGLMQIYDVYESELLKEIVRAEINNIESGEYSEKPFIAYGGMAEGD